MAVQFLIITFSGLCFLACQSTSRVLISGEPGIEVFKVRQNAPEELLGKIPLDIESTQLFAPNENTVQLSAHKGSQTNNLLVMKPQLPGLYNIKLNFPQETLLVPQTEHCEKSAEQRDYSLLAKSIAESQALIHRKNYEAAQIKLIALSNQFPEIAVIHDLLGNSYYLSKRFEDSLKSYQKSLKIDANNSGAAQMVERLKQIVKSE